MKTMNPRKNEDLQRNLPHPSGWGSAAGILENRRIGALRMGSTSSIALEAIATMLCNFSK